MSRARDLDRFYRLLDNQRGACGGYRYLRDCVGRMSWPARGVYFFLDGREQRERGGLRVVRVGTHAITDGRRSTLWGRLRQHRGRLAGSHPGGGNHRGSIFRRHVGLALLQISSYPRGVHASWPDRGASLVDRQREQPLEREVSAYIRALPLVWLDVPDQAGVGTLRSLIERNAIALLSNASRSAIDLPSRQWLGLQSLDERICASGLWNVMHVRDDYDPEFLDVLARLIDQSVER